MHIAFFNRSYWPDETATARLLSELCEDLVGVHGCRVTVVCGMPLVAGDEFPAVAQREGVSIHRAHGTRLSPRRFAGRATNYVTYFLSACLIGLRIERPDVVVSLTDPPIIGLAAWLAGRWHRAPLVMAFNDIFPEVAALLPDFRSTWVDRVLTNVNRFLVAHARVSIALGETMRRRLIDGKGARPADTVVIPSWADVSRIAPGRKDNPFARVHGFDREFVVMHSGNVGLSQELDAFLAAARQLRDRATIRFVIQGDGVRRQELEARARADGLSNVTFLPFAPADVVSDAFASADVFVVSLKRGLAGFIVPSKLYGILAAGRPYIAAVEDACEVAAITREFDSGVVIEPGSGDALARAILAMMADADARARRGLNARRAAARFAREVQVARYVEVFQRALVPSSSAPEHASGSAI